MNSFKKWLFLGVVLDEFDDFFTEVTEFNE